MNEFSLVTEKWIPVQTLDGQTEKVGLAQALIQAHEYIGVLDPSPLVTVALHRLLMALIYCVHPPIRNGDDWDTIWIRGRIREDLVEQYLEKHAHRFNLIDKERPFYQVPRIEGEKVHPIAALLIEASSGNNPALFDHGRVEGEDSLSLDRAACYLLAHQWFAVGGGVSKPFNRMDAPLAKGIVVESIGRNLFETLMLNTLPLDRWKFPPGVHDAPIWEIDNPPEPRKEGTPVLGPRQYLAWQSRRIHLVYEPELGAVTGCQILQQYCLPKDGERHDPGKAYYTVKDKTEGWQPQRLQKDRAAWRITHVLLQPATDDPNKPDDGGLAQPMSVNWLRTIKNRESDGRSPVSLPPEIFLAVSGLTTDPKLAAKVELWRREEIGMPISIVNDDETIRAIEEAIVCAEKVEWHLRQTATALAWIMTDQNQLSAAVEHIFTGQRKTANWEVPRTAFEVGRSLGVVMRFWASLEGPFRELLYALEYENEGIVSLWFGRLRDAARNALEPTLNALYLGGHSWEGLSTIENAFERRLAWILTLRKEESDEHAGATDRVHSSAH